MRSAGSSQFARGDPGLIRHSLALRDKTLVVGEGAASTHFLSHFPDMKANTSLAPLPFNKESRENERRALSSFARHLFLVISLLSFADAAPAGTMRSINEALCPAESTEEIGGERSGSS